MADSREIIGWFYKNGRRIPSRAKKGTGEEAPGPRVIDISQGGKSQIVPVVDKAPEGATELRQQAFKDKSYLVNKSGDNYYAVPKDETPTGDLHYVIKEGNKYGLTGKNELKKGMLVDYDPKWRSPGEEKYISIVDELYTDGFGDQRARIRTLNTKMTLQPTQVVGQNMIKPASKEKVDQAKIPGMQALSQEEITRSPFKGKDIKQRAIDRQVERDKRGEVLFINNRQDPVHKHAEIVPKLPDKTGKFNLGYAKMGDYQTESGTYTVHSDRDRFDQFGYYAVPKIGRSNVKRDPVLIRKAIKQPGQQAIKRVMKERGLDRQEAIKYLMEQRRK